MAFASTAMALGKPYNVPAMAGGVAGLIIGFTIGALLVAHNNGQWAGSAITWLWVGALMVAGCLGFIVVS